MADTYIQGSFVFTCTASESALIEEAWQHASDLMGGFAPGEPSAEFLAAFPCQALANPLDGLTAIFSDPDFPDFGADLQIAGAERCTVAIFGTTDFQPDAIAELVRRCCRESLATAPVGFDWSYSSNRPVRDGFGGGWCAIHPDRIVSMTTRDALDRALDTQVRAEQSAASPWISDPAHPLEDWKTQVANDETRLGYRDWIAARIEAAC